MRHTGPDTMANVEKMVVSHASWIYAKARRYYDNAEDAEDLAGETICKCLAYGMRFDSARSFRPWAQTIMENTYITQYNRRRCVLFTPLEDDIWADAVEADQKTAVDRIMSVVWECSRKSCCIGCVMMYAEGYSHGEIADRFHIPIGTVKSRISAGRRMLQDALGLTNIDKY